MRSLFNISADRLQSVCRTLVLGLGLTTIVLAGCRKDPPATGTVSTTGDSGESAKLLHEGGRTVLELDPASLKLAGITTVTAGVENLRQTVQPTGQVAPTDSNTVQVTARLPGRIAQVLFSVGQKVRKGQLLATVDSVDLTQAEATYRTALEHERLTSNQLAQQRKLAGYGALSEQPVEDARRAFAAAQAAVKGDEAQLALDRRTLENTRQLVNMGEITSKPVEDAQNAFAQAQAARIQAEVTLHSTKANLDRAQVLYDGGIYSKQQLEDAETAHNNAVASVDQTRTQESLASQELARQKNIYRQNLNGTASLQAAQSKLQQDEHTYQNDLTSLEVTRKELARAQTVHKSGIPVSQALQQAQDAYEEAKVALSGAESTLLLYGVSPGQSVAQLANGHAVIPIAAPLTGIVTARSMVVGQITDTSTPLAKIVDLDEVYVDSQVFEKDLRSVAVGDTIKLRVAAFPDRAFAGRVQYIGNEVSPDTRTVTVRTVIRNPGWLLRPGMFATVVIEGKSGRSAIAIPADSILQEGENQVVYVQVGERQFVKRTVRVGPAVNGQAPVYGGLQPGDRVVVTGNVLLQNAQEKLQSEKGSES